MPQIVRVDGPRLHRAILRKFGTVREYCHAGALAEATAWRAITGKMRRPYSLRRLTAPLGKQPEDFLVSRKESD